MKNDKGGQMKDLDFDELHEAVNKLMVQTQKPKTKREPAKSVAKAVTRPSVNVAERPTKEDKPEETSPSARDNEAPVNITVRSKPATKVMPKKRGMAMDVVQVAEPSVVAPPSARAARIAPTLQPSGPVTPEAPKPRETVVAASAELPVSQEKRDVGEDTLASLNMHTDGDAKPKTLLDDDKPVESAFPDPLDVHGFSGDEAKAEEPKPDEHETMKHTAPAVTPDPLPDDSAATPVAPVEEAPASPFLNTKVEKRPLGTYADSTPQPVAKPDALKPSVAAEEKPEPAAIDVPNAPAELRPEVVAVESASVDYAQPDDEPKKSDEPLGNLRQMSIPQQYHTHDKGQNKDERPIFDTKNYHPPLQPVATAKHHTGSKAGALLTLILIILLVAAGVGAYFVATGSIDIANLF